MRSPALQRLCMTALFAAFVFLAVACLPRIPFPGGYVHIGDLFLMLTAAFLPTPFACAAAAVGAGLADALTGYLLWLPATVLVKAGMAACFTSRQTKLVCRRNVAACLPAALLNVGGYYLWEALLTRSFAVPLASIPFNLMQSAVSAALFLTVGAVFDRFGLKKRLGGH